MDAQVNEWLKEAKSNIEAAFALFDLFELAEQVEITFNNRFTSKAGDANFLRKRIRLSTALWGRMTDEQRRQTSIHEAAHIIARSKYGYAIKSHGVEWKSIMSKCGLPPKRCHNIDTSGLSKKHPRYLAYCRCGHNHMLTIQKVNDILHGRSYICKKCKSGLVLAEESVAACEKKWEEATIRSYKKKRDWLS